MCTPLGRPPGAPLQIFLGGAANLRLICRAPHVAKGWVAWLVGCPGLLLVGSGAASPFGAICRRFRPDRSGSTTCVGCRTTSTHWRSTRSPPPRVVSALDLEGQQRWRQGRARGGQERFAFENDFQLKHLRRVLERELAPAARADRERDRDRDRGQVVGEGRHQAGRHRSGRRARGRRRELGAPVPAPACPSCSTASRSIASGARCGDCRCPGSAADGGAGCRAAADRDRAAGRWRRGRGRGRRPPGELSRALRVQASRARAGAARRRRTGRASAAAARNGPNGIWTSRGAARPPASGCRRRATAAMGMLTSAPTNPPDEDDERQRPPAEHGADDRQQLGVAEAEPLALEDVVVEVGDEAQEQVAGRGADEALQPGDVVGAERRQEEDRDRRERDDVGQELGGEVDERQHEQHAARTRSSTAKRARRTPAAWPGSAGDELPPQRRGEQPRQHLDQRIARRERRATGAAAAPQEEVGEDRDVVGGAHRRRRSCAQREPGRTIDSPRGTRTMQTLKKLPQTAPNSPAVTTREGRRRQKGGALTHGARC